MYFTHADSAVTQRFVAVSEVVAPPLVPVPVCHMGPARVTHFQSHNCHVMSHETPGVNHLQKWNMGIPEQVL